MDEESSWSVKRSSEEKSKTRQGREQREKAPLYGCLDRPMASTSPLPRKKAYSAGVKDVLGDLHAGNG